MYPHQVLMEENDLTKEHLSSEGKGYLKDFNFYLNAVNMKLKRAEKKGKELEVSPNEISKLNRLSKSIVVQIYSEMKEEIEQRERENKEEEIARQEAEELKREQEEEELKLKIENEKKKEEEERLEEEKLEEERLEAERLEAERLEAENSPPVPVEVEEEKKEEREESDDLMDFFF